MFNIVFFKKVAREFVPPIVHRLIKKILIPGIFPIKYQYKDFSILLPPDHNLPSFQKSFQRYDTFLPLLVKNIKLDEVIIDVGANVGDTLAAMVEENSISSYFCIEPDDGFFELLTENIVRIKKQKPNLKVQAIKSLVGKNISGISLEGVGGTKHAVVDKENSIQSRALDEILTDVKNIRILKTDVDGFDYDVIDSSLSIIQKHKPMIFLECQFDFSYQKKGYVKTLLALEAEGYCDLTIFDNFGGVLIRTSDFKVVFQLMEYIWSQNIEKSSRTIYYYDILLGQSKDTNFINKVLVSYQ
tara:strand:- start:4573 stop:5472 length:900 start_codon:yes stop_codon:yes gene_type:complete